MIDVFCYKAYSFFTASVSCTKALINGENIVHVHIPKDIIMFFPGHHRKSVVV